MTEFFFDYLRNERDRLDRELLKASSARQHDKAKVRSVWRLRQIVDDQMARWAVDLGNEERLPGEVGT